MIWRFVLCGNFVPHPEEMGVFENRLLKRIAGPSVKKEGHDAENFLMRRIIICTLHQNIIKIISSSVVMRSSIFWDITPCSRFKIIRRFGGHHIQG
jgi:hypothetical protein